MSRGPASIRMHIARGNSWRRTHYFCIVLRGLAGGGALCRVYTLARAQRSQWGPPGRAGTAAAAPLDHCRSCWLVFMAWPVSASPAHLCAVHLRLFTPWYTHPCWLVCIFVLFMFRTEWAMMGCVTLYYVMNSSVFYSNWLNCGSKARDSKVYRDEWMCEIVITPRCAVRITTPDCSTSFYCVNHHATFNLLLTRRTHGKHHPKRHCIGLK